MATPGSPDHITMGFELLLQSYTFRYNNRIPWILLILLCHIKALSGATNNTESGVVASCAGRCSEAYFPGLACYCNEACSQYENCCFDYYPQCRPDFVWTEDWVAYEGHEYNYFSEQGVSGEEAVRACRNHGGLLVSINSPEEQGFIKLSALRRRTLSAFIGGTDKEQEGRWRWPDGTLMPLPNAAWHAWNSGQPDNARGLEDCSVLTNYRYWAVRKNILDSYVWLDYSCQFNTANEIQGYICERTLACSPNPCQNNGSCLYIGATETEFICECQDGFLGEHCQLQVRGGELWTRCGETHLQGESGVINSPLYPKSYPANVRCEWLIEALPNQTLSLSVEYMQLERVKDCVFDHLAVYDGDSRSSQALLKPTCGSLSDNNTLLMSVTSSQSNVTVVFETDASVQLGGFSLHYERQRCGLGTGDSGCRGRRLFTTECGTVDIASGPAQDSTGCEWLIQVPDGNIIMLAFLKFHIEDRGTDCADGSLALYDEDAVRGRTLLGLYCGQRFPWEVFSKTNKVYLKLHDIDWQQEFRITIEYSSKAVGSWKSASPRTIVMGSSGTVALASSPVNIQTDTSDIYRWLVKVPVGDVLELEWHVSTALGSSLRIHKGFSHHSLPMLYLTPATDARHNGSLEIPYFQALVEFTQLHSRGSSSDMSFSYASKAWYPKISGCYRPLYYDNSSSQGTENNIVKAMEPVVIMLSRNAYDNTDPGYDAGLYCKWLIKGEVGSRLRLKILDSDVRPVTESCGYDGLVFYDGSTTSYGSHGPYCGSRDFADMELTMSSNQLVVVFYSDTRGQRRSRGLFKALVTTTSMGSCQVWDQAVTDPIRDPCGVILSPRFPGLVEPGQWVWLLQAPDDAYFVIYVYYVRGPNIERDCQQYFQLVEVTHDSGVLRQYESTLLKLCGNTDVFVPPKRIKFPPYQKAAIELSTVVNSFSTRWEFKLSFSLDYMQQPNQFEDGTICAEEYRGYRGKCYRYYPWVLRHYLEDQYTFQETWQKALEQCERENATLLSIHSEEEAYYLKYMWSRDTTQGDGGWFWDMAGTFQTNHRLIFIGLHNKYGRYLWTDGSAMSYSDWYQPPSNWEQPTVHEDTLVNDLLYLKNPQPTADVGSLCTVMLITSPFTSTNWAKIPCDYPIFRAGLICEKKGTYADGANLMEAPSPKIEVTKSAQRQVLLCAPGWFYVDDKCYLVHTNYASVRAPSNDPRPTSLAYGDAQQICTSKGGNISAVSPKIFADLKQRLAIWRHGPQAGHIWIAASAASASTCNFIKVYRVNPQNEEVYYELVESICRDGETQDIKNVLCISNPQGLVEKCGEHEFECTNGMCISVDHVCDDVNDCVDSSDEHNCECTERSFQCDNGKCISISLLCNAKDECGDNSDERTCVMQSCQGPNQHRCDNGQCIAQNRLCDFQLDCEDGSDELPDTCEAACRGFLCFSGTCLHPSLEKDTISDCPGLSLEDELDQTTDLLTLFDVYYESKSVTNSSLTAGCTEGGQYAQCQEGKPKCYDRAHTCVYNSRVVDEARHYEVQDYCRDGAHLRINCENVECPGMYHCPRSYCLPYHKLCDGTKDCPEGHDELGCEDFVCPGMFKCKGSSTCLAHAQVCDGVGQCPEEHGDEKYCNHIDVLCSVCPCSGHIASCPGRDLAALPVPASNETRQLRALLLNHNRIQPRAAYFRKLHWLGRLFLSNNSITDLPADTFEGLENLLDLDLSHNQLVSLPTALFEGLVSLHKVDLSYNHLSSLERETLGDLVNIRHLNLIGNVLAGVLPDAFDDTKTLEVLNTDAYKFCCIAKHVETCTPEADEFSSCEDLMDNYALQISIWVLGVVAFVGNIFVVAWRIRSGDRKKVSSFFIINLGCSDFLMGVYLLIIASVDVHYRGNYIMYADAWRSSWLCQFAGMIAMLSSEASVFMLTVITIDRAFAILFPLKVGKVRMLHGYVAAGCGWAVCLLLSVLPATKSSYFGDSFFGRTGVCLPFQISNEKQPGWEYSVFIFLVVNLFSFIVIFFCYLAIFLRVKTAAKKMGSQSTSSTNEYELAKKLAVIVATDFLCWVPIILIGFAALGGAKVSPQVSAWIAVFILPLNSAVNPLLYTISAMDCGRKRKARSAVSSTITRGGRTAMSALSEAASGTAVPDKSPATRTTQPPSPLIDANQKGPDVTHPAQENISLVTVDEKY